MKKTCASCQYIRQGHWCSNSKSANFRFAAAVQQFVQPGDTCVEFVKRGKKAPILMRLKIRAVKLWRRIR